MVARTDPNQETYKPTPAPTNSVLYREQTKTPWLLPQYAMVQGHVRFSRIASTSVAKPPAQVPMRKPLTGEQMLGIGPRKMLQPRNKTVVMIVASADPWSWDVVSKPR